MSPATGPPATPLRLSERAYTADAGRLVRLGDLVAVARSAGAAAPVPTVRRMARRVLARWAEPHRQYHTGEHLGEVLAALAQLGATSPAPVLGAWFHDAVYAGCPGRDERASAELAVRELEHVQAPDKVVVAVRDAVLATAQHRPSRPSAETQVWFEQAALLDADLAILAAGQDRYERYVAGVRAEHPRLDEGAFRAGRREVLTSLLAADPLFHTEMGRRLWQEAARANLCAELAAG